MRRKDRALVPFFARPPKPKFPFLGHFSLLRNHKETIAAQAKETWATSLQASSLGKGAQEFARKLAQRSIRGIVVVSPDDKQNYTERLIRYVF